MKFRSAIPLYFLSLIPLGWAGVDLRPELILYTYDSFVAKGGPGAEILPRFEKLCACKVRALSAGSGAQLIARLELDYERAKPTAQVVLGLDQHLWDRAKSYIEPWGEWRPKGYSGILPELKAIPAKEGFLPFDYGIFAMMADREALQELKLSVPEKLGDLLKGEWKRNIILEDPRTSTPGLAFLLYTQEVFGKNVWDFWTALRTQWLTLAPGWDGAYGLFLKKEAPLVWSYTTSQAYHAEHGDKVGRYQAILFQEGQPIQIEGAALVKGNLSDPAARARAQAFLEFLISTEVQGLLSKTNWMLPSVRGVALPASFKALPQPKKLFQIRTRAEQVKQVLRDWDRAVSQAKGSR